VLIASFAAGPLAANCYVLAATADADCVVVDPGMDALDILAGVVAEHRLNPVAVLLSHGHLDHVADAAAVGARWSLPVWIHPDDRAMLTDPLGALPASMRPLIAPPGEPVPTFAEPAELRTYLDGELLLLADLQIAVTFAPGHTGGSVLLRTAYPDDASVDSLLLTGDVLFAGSIGRTDLPGGDHATMLETLRRHLLSLPDSVVVLPGHGAQTTIARERAQNAYLSASYLS
jgi:glyoxylase-like metal-dependent hydrolase (beta-lactamase superfamily II)